jgi:hypothetical protein
MTYANACYSITSLAMASMLGGMVRPSAFAVPRLMIKSSTSSTCFIFIPQSFCFIPQILCGEFFDRVREQHDPGQITRGH